MTSRFLADENVPGAAVHALRAAGHDVSWIVETGPGLPDTAVLSQALREGRVILSFDKDFGELARMASITDGFGVILLRVRKPVTADDGRHLAGVVSSRDDWVGSFSVVQPGRIRMRPLRRS